MPSMMSRLLRSEGSRFSLMHRPMAYPLRVFRRSHRSRVSFARTRLRCMTSWFPAETTMRGSVLAGICLMTFVMS